MKKNIIIVSIFIVIGLFLNCSISNALTINVEDIKAKKGEEFTVQINMDSKIMVANGHIKFDSSKMEFVRASQENMNSNVVADGDLAWIYVDISGNGTDKYEFVFKLKENGESDVNLDDLAFVDVNGNEFVMQDIAGNKTFKVNKSNYALPIVVMIVAALGVGVISYLRKKNNR